MKIKNIHLLFKTLLGAGVILATAHLSLAQTGNTVTGTGAVNLGSANSVYGYYAGAALTSSAYNNTLMGYVAGNSLNTGDNNTLLGRSSGWKLTSGSYNTFLGTQSGYAITTGTYNVGVGMYAGLGNVSGSYNISMGYNSLYLGEIAVDSVELGPDEWEYYYENDPGEGSYNISIGTKAGYGRSEGNYNIMMGDNAGYYDSISSTAQYNVYVGSNSGYNQRGDYNLISGSYAGYESNGSNNLYLGYQAGYRAEGSNNVFLGKQAGYGETGSDKLYIENSDDLTTPLIYGDFAADQVGINATPVEGFTFTVGGSMNAATVTVDTATVSDRIFMNIATAQGVLIADEDDYATPASNNLIVKGLVGIGTPLDDNPNDYTLAVNGKIGAHDVRVERSSKTWPDYVFEEGYPLPSLQSVATYVRTHKHLEGVPSAQQVAAEGQSLAEMNAVLLKKVEELTLYLIEQDARLQQQQERMDQQDARIRQLEASKR